MKKKVDPKLRQEVKVKVDIVTSDIKIYYFAKFQDFTARYIIKTNYVNLNTCTKNCQVFLAFTVCIDTCFFFFPFGTSMPSKYVAQTNNVLSVLQANLTFRLSL